MTSYKDAEELGPGIPDSDWEELDDESPDRLLEFGGNVAGDLWEIVRGMSDLMKATMIDMPLQVINRFASHGHGEAGAEYRRRQGEASGEMLKEMGKGALESVTGLIDPQKWWEDPVHNALTAYFLYQGGKGGLKGGKNLFKKLYYKEMPKGIIKDFRVLQMMHEYGENFLKGEKIPKVARDALSKVEPGAIDSYLKLVNKGKALKARKFEYKRGVEPRFKRQPKPAPAEPTVAPEPTPAPGPAVTEEYLPAIRLPNGQTYTGPSFVSAIESVPKHMQKFVGEADVGYVTAGGAFVPDVDLAGAAEKGLSPKVATGKKPQRLKTVAVDEVGQGYKVTYYDVDLRQTIGREGEFVQESPNFYAFIDKNGSAFTIQKGTLKSVKLSDAKAPETKPMQRTGDQEAAKAKPDYGMSAEDIAKTLNISKRHLGDLIRSGKIPATKQGKAYRIMKSDLDRFLGAETEPTIAENLAETRKVIEEEMVFEPQRGAPKITEDRPPEPSKEELAKVQAKWVPKPPEAAPVEEAPIVELPPTEVPAEFAEDEIMSKLYTAHVTVEKVRAQLSAEGNTKELKTWDQDRKGILTGLHKRWSELGGTVQELGGIIKAARKTKPVPKAGKKLPAAKETISKITEGFESSKKEKVAIIRKGKGKQDAATIKAKQDLARLAELEDLIQTGPMSEATEEDMLRWNSERKNIRARTHGGQIAKADPDLAISLEPNIMKRWGDMMGTPEPTVDMYQSIVPELKDSMINQVGIKMQKVIRDSSIFVDPTMQHHGGMIFRAGARVDPDVVVTLQHVDKVDEFLEITSGELNDRPYTIYRAKKPFIILSDIVAAGHEVTHLIDSTLVGVGRAIYEAEPKFFKEYVISKWGKSYFRNLIPSGNLRNPYPEKQMERLFKEVACDFGSVDALRTRVPPGLLVRLMNNKTVRRAIRELDYYLHDSVMWNSVTPTMKNIWDIIGEETTHNKLVIKARKAWKSKAEGDMGTSLTTTDPAEQAEQSVFQWMQKHGEVAFSGEYTTTEPYTYSGLMEEYEKAATTIDKFIVTPSAKHPGKWQFTYFNEGTPAGDLNFDDYRQMLFVMQTKFNVDLSKAKVRKP